MEIIKTDNPLTLAQDYKVVDVTPGLTPNRIITKNDLVFTRPFLLLVNGKPVLRQGWDTPLEKGVVCHFVELPRGGDGKSNPLRIIAIIVVIIVSIYTGGWAAGIWGKMAGAMVQGVVAMGGMLVVNSFFGGQTANGSNGQIEQPDTMYSLTAGRNRLRIGQPFVEQFGRFICYPDLAMVPYTQMEDNDQYLYFLGIIGVGKHSVEGVYIDKTPLLDYAGTSYSILPPGTAPTICPKIVWTCAEITNQEITDAWLTAALSAAGTQASSIGWDIIFANGLVRYNDKAEKQSASVKVLVEARLITATGNAINAWVSLSEKIYTAAEKDPVRFSEKAGAPYGPGRYEIRIKLGTITQAEIQPPDGFPFAAIISHIVDPSGSDDSRVQATALAGGFRAYGPSHPDYGDVTMIECRLKATDQINGEAASKINVISTRKLKTVTSSGLSSTEVNSVSIIDACAHMVVCDNGGKQDPGILDYSSLAALRSELQTAQKNFSWRFSSRVSVMDGCAKAARCGRARPFMPSGRFSLIQDKLQPVVSQSYTEDDYTEGSFKISHIIRTDDSPTCIQVEYVDPDTWQAETVVCKDADGSLDNPAVIQLEGCSSRQQAYEEGMYMYWDDSKNRTQVEFTTGLKGHIPTPGQKLIVSADMTDWGQGGLIMAVETDLGQIWTDRPIDWKGQVEGYIYITDSNVSGTTGVLGPYTVTPTSYSHCMSGVIPAVTRTVKDHGELASKFVFGPKETDLLEIRLCKILPQGQNEIRLMGNIIHDSVYDDPGDAPAIGGFVGGDLLADVYLSYFGVRSDNYIFLATWAGRATKFKVEHKVGSGDYTVDFASLAGFTHEFSIGSGDGITVRVTPYDEDNVLQPTKAQEVSGVFIPVPTGLALTEAVGETVSVEWDEVTGADSYEVAICKDGVIKAEMTVTAPEASVTMEDITAMGGPWAEFAIYVSANKGHEQSYSAVLEVTVGAPSAVTGLALQARLENGVSLSWGDVFGATSYKIYKGDSGTFTPGAAGSSLVYAGSATNTMVTGLIMTGDYHHYFKAAASNGYVTDNDDLNWSSTLDVTPVTLTCTGGMVADLEVSVSGTTITLSWGGTATQFDILVEQTGETDKEITQMTGSQRTITGLVSGGFTATVSPYRSDGVVCDSQAESIIGTIT